jgi:hypothetical protein
MMSQIRIVGVLVQIQIWVTHKTVVGHKGSGKVVAMLK